MSDELVDGYKPIYRFTPTPELFSLSDKEARCQDLAEEYAVCADERANAGIIVYGKYNGNWEANPWSTRFLIKKLLMDAGIIKANQTKSLPDQ